VLQLRQYAVAGDGGGAQLSLDPTDGDVGDADATSTVGDAGDGGEGAMVMMSTVGAGQTGVICRVVSGRTMVPVSLTWKFMTPKVTVIPELGGISVDEDRGARG